MYDKKKKQSHNFTVYLKVKIIISKYTKQKYMYYWNSCKLIVLLVSA